MKGLVFDIQRFSIHDGPGIRTTVFFKGCPLRCQWCHNPESWLGKPQVLFYANKCIGCGGCLKACPIKGALDKQSETRINHKLCTDCGLCAEACPAEALVLCGREMTVEEVIEEVEKDRPFYETSGGGMTLSGGEPLMQAEFAIALLKAGKSAGLHTVLDTSGYGKAEHLREAARHVDLVLFDLKVMDAARHREVVGVEARVIHDNLRMLAEVGVPVIIRVPVIPTRTDSAENLRAIAEMAASLPNVRQVDLMRYNRLGESKWQRLGRPYELNGLQPPDDEGMNRLKAIVEAEKLEATVQG